MVYALCYQKFSIRQQIISRSPGSITAGLASALNILNKKIKSNQQSVQTLVCLAALTLLIFLLTLLTSVGP